MAAKQTPRRPKLPPVTVARFEVALALVERIVDEQTDTFIAKGQEFRDRHAAGTGRRLQPDEAAQVAGAMNAQLMVDGGEAVSPVQLAVAAQESDLRAYDEPDPQEVLLAAGIATAPAFMTAVKRFVALIEMDPDQFRRAWDDDAVDTALDDAVKVMAHDELAGSDGARQRASRAFDHFAGASGAPSGKALRELAPIMWRIVQQGTRHLGLTSAPASSSLTGSAPSTDGIEALSSTPSPTETPPT